MSRGLQQWKDWGTCKIVSWFKISCRGNSFISFFLISHAKYYLIRIKCILSLHDYYKYAYMEHVENIAIKLYNYYNQYDYIISSIRFIFMNLRSSIKSPRLKMLDDRVHNIDMSLSLNKFSLSPLTHQNLFKLL